MQDPRQFPKIEQEVISFSQQISQWISLSLLNERCIQKAVEAKANSIREEHSQVLYKVGQRKHSVKLLCGIVIALTCEYFKPKSKKKSGRKRGLKGAGLFLEEALLGIQEGVSSGLRSEVARLGVLLPSNALTKVELERRGISLNEKTIRSIITGTGLAALSARREELDQWRNGKLKASNELDGKRVIVSIDGARTRTRKHKKGKRGKGNYPRFKTPWVEPKLLIIYTIDTKGNKCKEYLSTVDGTLQGPDHIMELVAFHLFRLGAQKAKKVLFIADGAEWIWDRVGIVAQKVGLARKQWEPLVDFYHVTEHINNALKSIRGWDKRTRARELTKLHGWLQESKIEKIIAYLLAHLDRSKGDEVDGCIQYIEKRKDMMRYRQLKFRKWPIGSGAIESTVRRVVNLRLKCPSAFWTEENAEAVLYLRAQVLTGRWDQLVSKLHCRSLHSRSILWKWSATPLSCMDDQNAQAENIKELKIIRK